MSSKSRCGQCGARNGEEASRCRICGSPVKPLKVAAVDGVQSFKHAVEEEVRRWSELEDRENAVRSRHTSAGQVENPSWLTVLLVLMAGLLVVLFAFRTFVA